MQNFDFCPNLINYYPNFTKYIQILLNLSKFLPKLPKFAQILPKFALKKLLGDVAASPAPYATDRKYWVHIKMLWDWVFSKIDR